MENIAGLSNELYNVLVDLARKDGCSYTCYPSMSIKPVYKKLYDSNFVNIIRSCCEDTCPRDIVAVSSDVNPNLVESSIELKWDKPNFNCYDELTYQAFNKKLGSEFKVMFLLSMVKNEKFPSEPISAELFDNIIQNYLDNLVFTKWLYHDFVEYKNYVRDQKKRRRDNYKQNVRERLNQK